MSTISIVMKELVGLFIDDGSLAVAILALVGVVAVSVKIGLASALPGGALLVLGLAAILIENVVRSARKLGRR